MSSYLNLSKLCLHKNDEGNDKMRMFLKKIDRIYLELMIVCLFSKLSFMFYRVLFITLLLFSDTSF